jgi:ubiquinone biosynthesis protein
MDILVAGGHGQIALRLLKLLASQGHTARGLIRRPEQATDLQAVIRDLGFDQVPVDPTSLSGDQLVKEVQRVVKGLLGYGARMPKELMLYVKNLVFLDGAIARLAPDLDILAEVANISVMFAQRHGEQLGRDLGIGVDAVNVDLDGFKAGFGLDPSVERLTHRELQARRALIQQRMRERSDP